MRRVATGLLAALVLYACERPATEAPAETARPEPVVVYASYEDQNYLPSLFAEFTRETGIPVTVRHRPEEQIVSEVIEKRGAPPADLLLTRSVHGAWRTADEGALRPLQSEQATRIVPDWLRDPDGYWTAIGLTSIDVVCAAERREDCALVRAYEDLASPEFQGRLCLSASALAVNRTLIAGLIMDHRLRPAELIVRGWVANLALPPHETEAALLQALEAGTCGLAIVSNQASERFGTAGIAATWPQPGYFDVVAAGVNRHARSPDAAYELVDWLVGQRAQVAQFEKIGLRPVNPGAAAQLGVPAPQEMRNAAAFGLYEVDAVRLAERARWY